MLECIEKEPSSICCMKPQYLVRFVKNTWSNWSKVKRKKKHKSFDTICHWGVVTLGTMATISRRMAPFFLIKRSCATAEECCSEESDSLGTAALQQ